MNVLLNVKQGRCKRKKKKGENPAGLVKENLYTHWLDCNCETPRRRIFGTANTDVSPALNTCLRNEGRREENVV